MVLESGYSTRNNGAGKLKSDKCHPHPKKKIQGNHNDLGLNLWQIWPTALDKVTNLIIFPSSHFHTIITNELLTVKSEKRNKDKHVWKIKSITFSRSERFANRWMLMGGFTGRLDTVWWLWLGEWLFFLSVSAILFLWRMWWTFVWPMLFSRPGCMCRSMFHRRLGNLVRLQARKLSTKVNNSNLSTLTCTMAILIAYVLISSGTGTGLEEMWGRIGFVLILLSAGSAHSHSCIWGMNNSCITKCMLCNFIGHSWL